MAEKILNTRIQLRYDTYANWTSANTLLKAGEVAIATVSPFTNAAIPEGKTEGHPVLFKVGPGNFNDLPWASALAADVHSWAKKSESDFTTWVKGLIEVTDIDAYSKSEVDQKITALKNGDVKANADAIAAIKDHNSVDSFGDVMTEMAKYQLAGDYATKAEAQGYANAKDEAIAAAQQAGDDAMVEAQKKVASVTAGDGSVTIGGTATAPTVAVKLDPAADNALKLKDGGLKVEIGAAPEYSIVKDAEAGEYAAVYHLTKDGINVGAAINIPKDIVVKSGSVVGDEIVLVLNDEAATEIKIPVGSLIEYVTSGSVAGDMVVITVDGDHKVTASITDGSITLAKLHTDIQTAIGQAHSHENMAVLNGINADKVAAWDKVSEKADASSLGELASMNVADLGLGDLASKDKIAEADLETALATKINGKADDSALAAIAKTGNVNDLVQTSGDVLVFNCGDAAGNPLV